jgi:hypothetical protein
VVFFLLAQKKIQLPKTYKNMFSDELSFNDVPKAVAHLITLVFQQIVQLIGQNSINLQRNSKINI